jgi:hypothetical protein
MPSPYSASGGDVSVHFVSGSQTVARTAFFDGYHWNAILASQEPGVYKAEIYENGTRMRTLAGQQRAEQVYTASFVHVDNIKCRFRYDDGRIYWPIGNSLGWQDKSCPPMEEQLSRMGEAGMNWARIWACNFDGKNPWWPTDGTRLNGHELWQPAFAKWDSLVDAAERAGIHFQWVLFHHGEFSTTTDPEWRYNPWNKANGGFLDNPVDFFTDPEARARTKDYLRYVVARYAHSPAILSWELFNEVENTDAAHQGRWDLIGAWHKEMSDYLRSIDPYHHPITSSSELRPEVTPYLDYYQPHGYPSNVGAMLLGAKVLSDKPFFYGEVGLGANPPSVMDQRACVRDAIWCGLLAGHSGAAEYWYWDWVAKDNFFPEYAKFREILHSIGFAAPENVRPVKIIADGSKNGDLVFNPGIGWATSNRLAYTFPKDDNPEAMGQMSSFLQGENHRDMGSRFTFHFTAKTPGRFEILVGQSAKAGAKLEVRFDGTLVGEEVFPASDRDSTINKSYSYPFGIGAHDCVISNTGSDWIDIRGYTITGIGRTVSAAAALTPVGLVARLRLTASSASQEAELSDLPLTDGSYRLRLFGLDGSKPDEMRVRVVGGTLRSKVHLTDADTILSLQRVDNR